MMGTSVGHLCEDLGKRCQHTMCVWIANGQIARKQIVAVRQIRNNGRRRSSATADTSTLFARTTTQVLTRIKIHCTIEERVRQTIGEARRERPKLYDRHPPDVTPLSTMSNTTTSKIELVYIWVAARAQLLMVEVPHRLIVMLQSILSKPRLAPNPAMNLGHLYSAVPPRAPPLPPPAIATGLPKRDVVNIPAMTARVSDVRASPWIYAHPSRSCQRRAPHLLRRGACLRQ